MAAVAINVYGHRQLKEIYLFLNSLAHPNIYKLIEYLANVYAEWFLNHLLSRFIGGDKFKT